MGNPLQPALTQEQAAEIRKTYIEDNSTNIVPTLAELYEVSTFTIYKVLNYESPYDAGKPKQSIIKRQTTSPKREKKRLITRSEMEAEGKTPTFGQAVEMALAPKNKKTVTPHKDFVCPHCLGSGMLVPKNMSLGQLLLFHRHRLNMTTKQVEKAAKISHGSVSLYERDKVVEPKFTTLWPLLQFYGIDPNELPPMKKVKRKNRYTKA